MIFYFSSNTRDNCHQIGCQWCFLSSNGAVLSASDQFCGFSEDCPRGKMNPIQRKEEEETTDVAAIVIPIVVVIVICLVAVVIWYLYRRRATKQEKVQPDVPMTVPAPRRNEVMI